MLAVICVALLTVVEVTVMPDPPKLTELTPLMKLVPVNTTARVAPWAPVVGKILVNVGAGLFIVTPSPGDKPDSLPVCVAHLALAQTVKDPAVAHALE
jgi:hypothetical protein